MTLIALLVAFTMIQVAVVVGCFSRSKNVLLRNMRSRAVTVLIAVEIVSVISLFLGAYGEARWRVISEPIKLFQPYNSTQPSEVARANNPSLIGTLDSQRPSLLRPNSADPAEFKQWQESLRHTLRDNVFRLPDVSTAKNVLFTVRSKATLGGDLTRELITFSSYDGVQVPAYLFSPGDTARRPAIIVVPGHVKEHESGIEQTAVLYNSYQHAAALKLAEAGFVTLTFELRGFGQLANAYATEHRLVAYNAILAGTFYKAVIARDIKHAVDFLQNRIDVDPERIGITGVSYGGEMSVAYAALDLRIKTIVFQAYGGSVGTNPGVSGTKDDQPHYCHIVPGANLLFRQEDLFLLLAPRPTLGIRGGDGAFKNLQFNTILQGAWKLYGKPDLFNLRVETGGHEFFVQPAVEFFKKYL